MDRRGTERAAPRATEYLMKNRKHAVSIKDANNTERRVRLLCLSPLFHKKKKVLSLHKGVVITTKAQPWGGVFITIKSHMVGSD